MKNLIGKLFLVECQTILNEDASRQINTSMKNLIGKLFLVECQTILNEDASVDDLKRKARGLEAMIKDAATTQGEKDNAATLKARIMDKIKALDPSSVTAPKTRQPFPSPKPKSQEPKTKYSPPRPPKDQAPGPKDFRYFLAIKSAVNGVGAIAEDHGFERVSDPEAKYLKGGSVVWEFDHDDSRLVYDLAGAITKTRKWAEPQIINWWGGSSSARFVLKDNPSVTMEVYAKHLETTTIIIRIGKESA